MIAAAVEFQVEFSDVDAMKVVWHGNYPRYLETARRAVYDKLGYGYREMELGGIAWPIVDLHIKYVRPAVLGQKLRVTAELSEWENRMVMDFAVLDAATGEKLTKARCVQVAVDASNGEMRFETPADFQALVRKAMG